MSVLADHCVKLGGIWLDWVSYKRGREWVDNPSVEQRCQIAADKLLTALETENKNMQMMMTACILSKNPMCETVVVDIQGKMSETHFM